MSAQRAKGTRLERAVADYLAAWPPSHRADREFWLGIAGVAIEAADEWWRHDSTPNQQNRSTT